MDGGLGKLTIVVLADRTMWSQAGVLFAVTLELRLVEVSFQLTLTVALASRLWSAYWRCD